MALLKKKPVSKKYLLQAAANAVDRAKGSSGNSVISSSNNSLSGSNSLNGLNSIGEGSNFNNNGDNVSVASSQN